MISVSVEQNLYPKISKSITQTGAQFPEFLAKNFARIFQRIELLWGEKEILDYFDSLFLGDIPDDKERIPYQAVSSPRKRQGFPVEAVKDIVLLKQVHQLLYPSTSINAYDPFSGSEIVPIEKANKTHVNSSKPFAIGESGNTAAAQLDLVNEDSDRKIAWPFIRSQHELIEIARLQHSGKTIYPLQGKQVGEILMHYGVIEEEALRVVGDMQKRAVHKNHPVGEILTEIGLIDQASLSMTLLIQAGIPIVDLFSIDVPADISKIIPLAKAREKMAVPIGTYHNTLYLAVADPFTFTEQSFFTMMTGMKVCLAFAPMHEILNCINKHGLATKSTQEAKEEFRLLTEMKSNAPLENTVDEDNTDPTFVSENDSIIVNLVNQIIFNAIQEEASDIHIEIFNDGADARIRFRRDGNMEHFSDYPRSYHKALVSRIKIMSGLDISEKRRPQDGKISFAIPNGRRVDLRVATIPTTPGVEFVTIRILASGEPVPLSNLGMASRDSDVFREVFLRPYGLILVCGPTGSGKTTTLHSVLKELNTEDRKIWTAEDPIEIVQPHLSQVQINSKVGMTFATVLRSFLRADPDVIMIGEMRDQETAKIALEASMTGHLVLSTLHTNSASETVARLLDLDIDPYNLSDALLAILAQRLARKLCTLCAKREEASDSDIEDLANEYYQSANAKLPTLAERNTIIEEWRKEFAVNGKLYFMHAAGCDKCNGGYKGRIGLYELLHVTPHLRHLIRLRSAASDYLAAGVANGMRTLKQDGIEKVIRGITDMQQVHAACI